MKTSPDSPAFGFSETDYFEEQPIGSTSYPGLTKREYFAVMAMQGQLAGEDFMPENQRPPDLQAALAVRHADALIAALNAEA